MQRIMQLRPRSIWFAFAGVFVLIIGLIGLAHAAEFGSGDLYELKAGQVVSDDLYVSAGQIQIDGDVEGDLLALGGTIVVNGNVKGDIMAAGGSIEINGTVGDDVRVAGGGVTINGSVGDDLIAAAGGQMSRGFTYPMVINGQAIQQGIFLTKDAVVNGDAYFVGGSGDLAGTVKGNLFAAMGTIQFAATVGGNADLRGNTVTISDTAKVSGELKYESETPETAPAGVAAQVTPIVRTPEAPVEEPFSNRLIGWLIRLARVLVGVLALGAVMLFLFPRFTNGSAELLNRNPWTALAIGFIVALVAIPLTMVFVGLAWLFWGFFPGGVSTLFFLVGLWGILWMVGPIIAGFCLGKSLLRNSTGRFLQLFLGAVLILILARAAEWIPMVGGWVGWLVLIVTWMFSTGAIILHMRRPATEAPAPVAPVAPVATEVAPVER